MLMEVVVTTGATRRKKAPVKSSPPTNQRRPDALPVAQPTVSKHWRKEITFQGVAYPNLTWGSSNFVFDH